MAKLKDGTRVYGDATVDQTLTVGNIAITGNLIVQGSTTTIDTTVTRVEDPIFELGGGAEGAPLTGVDGKDRGILMHYYASSAPVDSYMGWNTNSSEFQFGAVATEASGVITVATYGNLRANVFFGDGGGLSNIQGSNVTGDVAGANRANYAGIVTGNAQGNITSVGTLTGLTVGNSTANTVFGNGTITATGNISTGSSIIANGATSQFILGTSANTAVANIYGNLNVTGKITGTIDATIGAKGTDTNIQFNDAGNINGTGGFTFDKTSNTVTIGADITLVGDGGDANIRGTLNLGKLNSINVLNDDSGQGIEMYSTNVAQLNFDNTNYVSANTTGIFMNAGAHTANLLSSNGQFAISNSFSAAGDNFTVNQDGNVNAQGYGSFAELYITDAVGSGGQVNYIDGMTGQITGDGSFTYVEGLLSASNLSTGNADITGYVNLTGHTAGNLLTTDVGGNVIDSNVSFSTDTLTLTNANVTGNLKTANLQVTNLGTTGALLYTSDIGGNVTESGNLSFNDNTNTLSTDNVTVSGNIVGNTVTSNNLVSTQLVFTASDKSLTSSAGLSFASDTLSANNITSSGHIRGNTVQADNLTDTQVVFANVGGNLVGDSSFTFGSDTLSANLMNAKVGFTSSNVHATNLTNHGIVIADSTGKLVDDAANGFAYYTSNSTLLANTVKVDANITASNANLGNLVTANYVAGTLTTAAQPNITSVGNLTSLTSFGNITVANSASGGSASAGIVTDNLYYSNGATWDLQQAAGSTTEIQFNTSDNFDSSANFTFDKTGSGTLTVSGTGNITTINATDVNSTNVTATSDIVSTGGNIHANVNVVADGNVSATWLLASDANITGNATVQGKVLSSTVEALDSVDLTLQVKSTHTNGNIVLIPGSATGVIEVSGAKITNLAEPTSDQDAATKYYVDHVAQGLHVHGPVAAATTTNLTAFTGISTPFTLDGYTVQNNDRVLVKDQTTQSENGIYVYSTSGSSLTRASDSNSAAEFAGGDFCFVINGDTQGDTGWVQTEVVTTLGSDNIIFQQFSGAGSYTAATAYGMQLDGTVFRTKIDGFYAGTDPITDPDSGTLTYDGNGNIKVADHAVFIAPYIGNATGYDLDLTGNISAYNANFGGVVFSEGNITLGTGSYLNGDVHGNISGNIKVTGANGSLQFASNVTTHGMDTYGDLDNAGANLTYISGVLTVNVGNGGNVVTDHLTGTIETASQPNITSTGTLNYLNVSTSGGGNGYVTATQVNTNNLYKADGTTPWDFATAAGSNHYIQFSDGTDLAASANLQFDSSTNNLTVNGNIITGTGSGGNISGADYVIANYFTGTLTTGAQPNITSVGTLSSLEVTNDITSTSGTILAGNIGNATTYLHGDGSNISNISGANVSEVALATHVTGNAQGNITSVGTLTSLNVSDTGGTGNITADNVFANSGIVSGLYLYGDGSNISSIAGANVTGWVEQANIANVAYAVSGGNITGTSLNSNIVTSNLTSVGTLTSLTVANTGATGNILANNITVTSGGQIGSSGIYLYGNGSNITGVTASSIAAANITGDTLPSTIVYSSLQSVGTLNGLTANSTVDFTSASNVSLGSNANVHISGGTSGQYLQTNGSGALTWSTIDLSMIDNGTSNVAVALNGNVTVGITGSEVINIATTGLTVTGIITATGNITGDNIISNNYVIANSTDDATDAVTGAITTAGGISAQGNIYTGDALGFAHGSGNTDSAAYIKYNATAGSIDFIFN